MIPKEVKSLQNLLRKLQYPLKWAVVIHGSHYGLIKGNIAYGFAGAGFVTEDGTESYNEFDGNMAIGILGFLLLRFIIVLAAGAQ